MTYSNILVPVVFDENPNTLERPLSMARDLCAEGGKITLVHVLETPPSYAMQYIPKDLVQATQNGIRQSLAAATADVPSAKYALLSGSPGREITDFAASHGADLIVMASHRPGMGDILWGSTAGFVVRHVGCSVHVLR